EGPRAGDADHAHIHQDGRRLGAGRRAQGCKDTADDRRTDREVLAFHAADFGVRNVKPIQSHADARRRRSSTTAPSASTAAAAGSGTPRPTMLTVTGGPTIEDDARFGP